MSQFNSLEMCAGAGGQALGLEMAGFDHSALIELEPAACATLRLNRPAWNVIEDDLRRFDGTPYKGVDLVAGGVPCPPFSKAGKQLGAKDERDLFPEALRLVDECRPQAVMLENVRGLLDAVFDDYRNKVETQLKKLGFAIDWSLRPEFADIAPHVRLWNQRFTPEAGEEDAELSASPDLGPLFEFQEKTPGEQPGLEHIHCFCYPAALSHGTVSGDIPAISDGARKLAQGLASLFYREDLEHHYAQLQSYSEPELDGSEWTPADPEARVRALADKT